MSEPLQEMYAELTTVLMRGSSRSSGEAQPSHLLNLTDDCYANGIAFCIARIESTTKQEVLARVRQQVAPKKIKRTMKRTTTTKNTGRKLKRR